MTKEKAMMMAEQINAASFNAYEPTRVYAEVIGKESDCEVNVKPSETNDSPSVFYHVDDLGIIAQGYNVKVYAKIENGAIIVRMW